MKIKFEKFFILLAVAVTAAFGQNVLQSRIERVEKGLLPAVLVKGDPTWTVQERMTNYKIPGVSITVIDDFKIAW